MYKIAIILVTFLMVACGGADGENNTSDFGTGGDDSINGTGSTFGDTGGSSDGGTSTGGSNVVGGTGGSNIVGGTGGNVVGGTGGSNVGGTGGGTSTDCVANSKVCDSDGNVKSCNSSGTLLITFDCDFACQDGECMGECVPDSTDCNGDTVQTCDGTGTWNETQSCSYACDEGACTGVCVPESTTCDVDGKTPQTCDSSGKWVDKSPCQFSCTDGSCTGACTNGTKTCLGDSAATCTNEAWVVDEECDFICSSGSCSGVCVPDDTQCSGSSLQTCGSNGQWNSGNGCIFACYGGSCTGVCTPGEHRCDNFDVEVCNEQGQWEYSETCMGDNHGDPTCGGAGVCGIDCENGYEDCDGNPANGCESLSSAAHCGSCGTNCSAPSGFTPSCENFGGTLSCGITCPVGKGDCDGNPINGCEVNLLTDVNNCGSCNTIDSSTYNTARCDGTCSNGVCNKSGEDARIATGFIWDDNELETHNGNVFYTSTYYRQLRVRNFNGTRFDSFKLANKPYSINHSGPVFVITTLDSLDKGGVLRYDDRDKSFITLIDGSDGFKPSGLNAIDSSHFYWVQNGAALTTDIYRVPLDKSTAPTVLANVPRIAINNEVGADSNYYIVLAGNYLIYGPQGQSKVVVINKSTGTWVTDITFSLHTSPDTNWMPLVGDSNHFFYYDGSGVTQVALGTWAQSNAISNLNWAYLDTELVTADANSPGNIQFFNPVSKIQKTTGIPSLVGAMTVDSNYIYASWSSGKPFSIYRMARP